MYCVCSCPSRISVVNISNHADNLWISFIWPLPFRENHENEKWQISRLSVFSRKKYFYVLLSVTFHFSGVFRCIFRALTGPGGIIGTKIAKMKGCELTSQEPSVNESRIHVNICQIQVIFQWHFVQIVVTVVWQNVINQNRHQMISRDEITIMMDIELHFMVEFIPFQAIIINSC
jgi:hypothetical protein